jgi:AraC family transcriptional regulator
MDFRLTHNEQNAERLHSVIAYINEQIVRDWAGNAKGFAEATGIERILQQSDRVFLSSKRHFQQLFFRMTGECIGTYINNLRLERAAHLLQNTNLPVLYIANSVGYASENALFKPFKRRFNTTPLRFKNHHKTNLPTGTTPVREDDAPEGAFCLLPPQHFIYRTYIGDYSNYNSIAFDEEAWDSLYEYAAGKHLLPSKPDYYGICMDDSNIRRPERCCFYACMTVNRPLKRADGILRPLEIKGGKYSIYKHTGSYNGLNAFYQAIFRHFKYKLRDDFILERYLNGPQEVGEEALETEILIPVIR